MGRSYFFSFFFFPQLLRVTGKILWFICAKEAALCLSACVAGRSSAMETSWHAVLQPQGRGCRAQQAGAGHRSVCRLGSACGWGFALSSSAVNPGLTLQPLSLLGEPDRSVCVTELSKPKTSTGRGCRSLRPGALPRPTDALSSLPLQQPGTESGALLRSKATQQQ